MNIRKKFLLAIVFWFLAGAFFGCAKETPQTKDTRPTKVFTFIGSEKECNDVLAEHKDGEAKMYPLTNSSGQVVNYVLVITEKVEEKSAN